MAERANEDGYETVDENTSEDGASQMSSDESQSDVGADDSHDLNEDGACGDGDESPNRRAHHSDVEKMRKKLIASYARAKKVVTKVWGYRKGLPNRRAHRSYLKKMKQKLLDASTARLKLELKMFWVEHKGLASLSSADTLQISNHLIKENFQERDQQIRKMKECRAKLHAALPTLDGKLREVCMEAIDELNECLAEIRRLLQLQPLTESRASEYINEGEESEEEVENSRLITVANVDDPDEDQGAGVGDRDLGEEADDEEWWATTDEDSDSDDTAPSPSGDNVL